MPTESLVLSLTVLAIFVGFAVVLAWADSKTRGLRRGP
jgi:hypothetical protein